MRSDDKALRQARAGFTLVEVLYVAVILGIMAGIAFPMLNVDRFRVNTAVVEIATELMAAQRAAILRGHDVIVAINQPQGRLRVHVDADNDGRITSGENWKVVDLQEGVTFGLGGATKLSDANPPITFTQKQGTLPAITFHRNGSASEMGFIYITGAGGGGTGGENSRAVEVIRSTARVKCWSYQTGSWMETC